MVFARLGGCPHLVFVLNDLKTWIKRRQRDIPQVLEQKRITIAEADSPRCAISNIAYSVTISKSCRVIQTSAHSGLLTWHTNYKLLASVEWNLCLFP